MKNIKKSHLLLFRLIIVSSFVVFTASMYIIVFKNNTIPVGWDTRFHLNRIEEIRYSLAHHQLFPSNGLHSFSNIGLAINTFYPYLFLYPIALLQLVLAPIKSYYIGLAIYTFSSFLISFIFAKKILNSTSGAYIFSLLYNTGSYLLLQITLRTDIGEYLALIFLPIAFYGLTKLDDSRASWIMLPIGMALIAYSHILSIVIFAIAFFIYLCLSYKNITLRILKRIMYSITLFGLILLPFLIRFITIKKDDHTFIPATPKPLKEAALIPAKLFNNSISNVITYGLDNVNFGITLIITSFILICCFRKLNVTAKKYFLTGIILVLITTSIFPWFLFQRTPLVLIQFPWRFLGPASFFVALSAGLLFSNITITNKYRYIMPTILLLLPVLSFTNYYAYITDNTINSNNYFTAARNAEYQDYMPNKAIPYSKSILNHTAIINGKKRILNKNNYLQKPRGINVTVRHLKPNQENTIDLPILRYSYDQKYKRSKRGTILIKTRPKHTSQTLNYMQGSTYPPIITIIIALGTTFFSLAYFYVRK